MAIFNTAYNLTDKIEGGYVNDPDDNGGETYRGIARNKHSNWRGWYRIDEEKRKTKDAKSATGGLTTFLDADEELQKLVKKFYYEEFWCKINGNLFSDQRIVNEVYDNAVNMGPEKSAEILQRTINVLNKNQRHYLDITVDKEIGRRTIMALEECIKHNGTKRVLNVLNGYQIKHYLECMEKNPINEKFLGWFDRVEVVWN
jgi:lysozyme family protein